VHPLSSSAYLPDDPYVTPMLFRMPLQCETLVAAAVIISRSHSPPRLSQAAEQLSPLSAKK
jgi:hypothetical protein